MFNRHIHIISFNPHIYFTMQGLPYLFFTDEEEYFFPHQTTDN